MKNLEDEYKRFNQEETPDLWNRIEAGLTDKKVKRKKNIFTFKYASICAAAVLLVVLLPGIYFFGRNGRSADNAAPQNGMPEPAGSGAADMNGMAEDSDFVCEAETGEKNEVSGSFQQDSSSDAESGERNEAYAGGNDGAAANVGAPSASEDRDGLDMQGNSESAASAPTSDGVLQEAEKSVEQLLGNMEVTDTEQKDGRTIYYLRTEDGQLVSAVTDVGMQTVFEIGKDYLFTLRASGEEAWEYVIEAAE